MDLYKKCTLCPRRCGIDRTKSRGRCGQTATLYAARASLHMWEEPCISGKNGSGTVFFSGCPLGCVYCQNSDITASRAGVPIDAKRLAEIFLEMQNKGAHNINLVTPTHFAPHIIRALDMASGLKIPVLYNTSGYETVETLRMLDGYVDIYLPDFKYMDSHIAEKYSCASDYPETAKAALSEMVRQTGACEFDADGMLRQGTIARHLVLPNHMQNSKDVIEYLYRTYGNDIYMSIMSQYTPMPRVVDYPEINRRVTDEEYDEVVDFAAGIGVENAFVQEGEAASESFIPSFDGEGIIQTGKETKWRNTMP